ncbi:uncharacterized protein [Hoplias malabaricus]|uniref:uncharacterized protein n=1 Tax=Hoplias malabaricus TaxID=27720 RepID=UPI003462A5ED
MQLLSLLFCGLLFSFTSLLDCNADFIVTQIPPNCTVQERGSVSIDCCWNKTISSVKIKWFKDNQSIESISDAHLKTETPNNTCSALSIMKACKNHTGIYICEVTQDIPILLTVKGTRTMLNILEFIGNISTPSSTPPKTSPAQSSVTVVGVSVSGAIALFLCAFLTVWRTCKKTERVVIREGPPSEGEEPDNSEEDENSRNSRGSTQWYMVPVYESYFDLQRNDEEQSPRKDNSVKTDKSGSLGKTANAANK